MLDNSITAFLSSSVVVGDFNIKVSDTIPDNISPAIFLGISIFLSLYKEYTIVQNNPNRVGFSKTSDTSNKTAKQYLDDYMATRGFHFVPEEQLGSMLVYSNDSEKEYISFSMNRYYSKWEWL